MAYPNYKNKHLEEALFHPRDFVRWAHKENKIIFPKKWIITFQKHAEGFIRRNFKVKKHVNHSLGGNIYIKGRVGFIRIRGIGAPHACTVLEELIAIGGREFIITGTAGGLKERGLFLCNRAIRDEGTSIHYVNHSKYSYPNKELTFRIKKFLESKGLKVELGTSWTIDAPYRETKKEINYYKREGVKTVEMEASAMFTVARLRRVKIAAIFSVSDIIGNDKWEPHFDKKHYKIAFHKAIAYSYELLRK